MKKTYDDYIDRIGKELKSLYPQLYFGISMEKEKKSDGNYITLYIVVYEKSDILFEDEKTITCLTKELTIVECCYKNMKRYEEEFDEIVNYAKYLIEYYTEKRKRLEND